MPSDATSQPAELSGASPNPKLQLLGIALEVRTMIFREILIDATNTAIGLTFRHYTPNGVRYKRKRNGTQQAYQTTCRVNARQDRQWSQMLSLLRVSRQTYEEGCPIFYGLNAWYKSSVQNFEYHPSSELPQPSDLPAKKMALIKDLSLKFDLLSTRANFATFDELIGFICSGFPRLQHLRLTFDSKQYTRAFWGQASSNGYVKEMGALLSVVATLTRQHPVLKKAIWSAESGVRHHYTNSYRDMPVLQLFSGGIAPHHSEYSFVVDLVTPRREDVLFNAGGGGLDDNGEASISKVCTSFLCPGHLQSETVTNASVRTSSLIVRRSATLHSRTGSTSGSRILRFRSQPSHPSRSFSVSNYRR